MKIFFSGIGGSGVSAIAGFLAEKGISVSGSDRLFDKEPANNLLQVLKAQGITIAPHDGTGIDRSVDLVVFSTAVEKGHPELQRAEELNIPVKTRPEYLSEIVAQHNTIAIAGTSGKSTTSGMLAFIMHRLGMDPNFIGGGRVKQFRNAAHAGNCLAGSSDILVVEACESDGTLVNYRPAHSIIANLDFDHHTVEETASMFNQLSRNTSGLLITGADDMNLRSFGITGSAGFSIVNASDCQAKDIEYHHLKTVFTVNGQQFLLSLPGRFNLYNALACIALLCKLGVPEKDIAAVLPDFTGIERRFDIHLNNGRHLVVDDYAHNPHKISSLMQTMQDISSSICYIFQPHGFGPTRLMKQGYIDVFTKYLRDSDHLMLLPIYYAGGTASKDISSRDIADAVKASGKPAEAVQYRDDVLKILGKQECYVICGARDESLSVFAHQIAGRLKV